MSEELEKKILYEEGFRHFKNHNYFEAHESWEELWSDYYNKDRKFIQGLIQLSVSFVHLENGNMIGATNLLKKAKEKFQQFKGSHRNINVSLLLAEIESVGNCYAIMKKVDDFDWELVPTLG